MYACVQWNPLQSNILMRTDFFKPDQAVLKVYMTLSWGSIIVLVLRYSSWASTSDSKAMINVNRIFIKKWEILKFLDTDEHETK